MLIPVFVGLALPLALTACPGGADLEDPDRFISAVGGAGMGGTAGTAGMGGTAGSVAGNAGSAGKTWVYTPPVCDYQTPLRLRCAAAGCHNAATKSAGLDLASPGIENRLIDVIAPHDAIGCPNPDGGPFPVTCVPPGCSLTAKYVDTASPADSWMLKKLSSATEVGDCGDPMPIAPQEVTAEERDCLIAWINAMAAAQ